jgi:hypothetical protein
MVFALLVSLWLFKFAPGEFVCRQKKVSKEKVTRMPLISLGTSLRLALRVLRMQIGYPADLSLQKLRCSARHTGEKTAPALEAYRRRRSTI